MKKIYLHLMALICLFLFGGVNVWATVYTWEAPSTQAEEKDLALYGGIFYRQNQNKDVPIPNTPVIYKVTSTAQDAYDYNNHGIKVSYAGHSYFKTNNPGGGYITLYLEASNPLMIYVLDGNGSIIAGCSPKIKSNDRNQKGNLLSFKMEQGVYYEVHGETSGIVEKLIFYTPDEVDEIILDENETDDTNQSIVSNAPTSGRKFVSTIRTLKGNIWNTFCLPINLSNAELQDLFRCSAVYEMSGYNSSNYQITFTKKSSYTAGKPCLIMPQTDYVNPSFITTNSLSSSTTSGSGSDLMFVGVYGTENIFTTGDEHSTKFYLNTNSYLVYPENDPSNIKGLRAYFEWASAPVKNLSVSFDGIETGIKMVEKDIFQENGNVYSIDGRFVGNSTDNLTRGIYIQNGRKFVVK